MGIGQSIKGEKVTEISEDILNKVLADKALADVKHNWLYSVVPLFPENGAHGGIYLAGYCKQCRNAFTVRLQEDYAIGFLQMRKLDIPVWGCVPLE